MSRNNRPEASPRARIAGALKELREVELTGDFLATELAIIADDIAHEVSYLKDPPTAPEIAALSTKKAWWCEGFVIGLSLGLGIGFHSNIVHFIRSFL